MNHMAELHFPNLNSRCLIRETLAPRDRKLPSVAGNQQKNYGRLFYASMPRGRIRLLPLRVISFLTDSDNDRSHSGPLRKREALGHDPRPRLPEVTTCHGPWSVSGRCTDVPVLSRDNLKFRRLKSESVPGRSRRFAAAGRPWH